MDSIKTRWHETPRPYSDYEIEIIGNDVIFKEWWDPGHDPNRSQVSLNEFENSKVAQDIVYHLGESIYMEVLESVQAFMGK